MESELLVQGDRLVGGKDAVLVIDDTAMPKEPGQAALPLCSAMYWKNDIPRHRAGYLGFLRT